MFTVLLLAAAAVEPERLPPSIAAADAETVIELTCHFQTSRYRFHGRHRVVIEDLDKEGAVAETHRFEHEGLHDIVLARILDDGFADDPEPAADDEVVVAEADAGDAADPDGIVITGECRDTTIDVAAPGNRMQRRYDWESDIPGDIHEILGRVHFQANAGLPIDAYETRFPDDTHGATRP